MSKKVSESRRVWEANVVMLIAFLILTAFYFISTAVHRNIVVNRLISVRITSQWSELKANALLQGKLSQEQVAGFAELLEETTQHKAFRALGRNNTTFREILLSISKNWQMIEFGFSSASPPLPRFLSSARVLVFEQNLQNFHHFIDVYSQKQRAVVTIQHLFVATLILMIFSMLIANMYTVKQQERVKQKIQGLNHALIQMQEHERGAIALDLHDDIIQDLALVKMDLERIIEEQPTSLPSREELQGCIASCQSLIKRTREISLHLRPHDIDHLGLVGSIKTLCKEFSYRHRIDTQVSAMGVDAIQLSYSVSINIYRIVQEALNNIWKHAKATDIRIKIIGSSPDLIVRIKDNGVGFSPDLQLRAKNDREKIGLTGMKERARFLGGGIRINSALGSGTELVIRVPATF